MTEWLLLGILIGFAGVLAAFLVYPLRLPKAWALLLATGLVCVSGFAYYLWGGFIPWHDYQQVLRKQELTQRFMRSIKSPQDLIAKLKAKLALAPNSAKGWYLLGRLYSSQNNLDQAVLAFAQAHQLAKGNEQYTVNYAQSLWQQNHQQFTPAIKELCKQVLQKNPEQADALAMLAMDAYVRQEFAQAIGYWQRLLHQIPPGSEEADFLRKAIAKAQKNLG